MNPVEIQKIKHLLWQGMPQTQICQEIGCSQATISRILNGKIGPEIPWPNGSTGSLSAIDNSINMLAARFRSFTPEMQERVLNVVNRCRLEAGMGTIPASSDEYASYLASDPTTPDIEAAYAARAKSAEDARASTIMAEFDQIVLRSVQASHASAYDAILEGTHDDASRWDEELPEPNIPLSFEMLDWDLILRVGRHHALIDKIAESDDPILRNALAIAAKLHETNPAFWGTPAFARLILDVKRKLIGVRRGPDDNRQPEPA